MQVITSKDNEVIKSIRKLKDKKYREQENKYLVEGIKLIEEALDENASIDTIVVCEDCEKNGTIEQKLMFEIAKHNCIYVSEKVFNAVTEVTNPQGILAVINKENKEENIDYNQDMIVVLDGIQDPGNLGTILRTVDSVGLNQIIISKQTADAYNPKVVRSTMGAIFRVNVIVSEDIVKTLKEAKKHKFKVLATSLETNNNIYDIDYNKKVLVIRK
ncbi:MAG: RNA methyltransferase [Clostridia bacterium]|nr:RNA methyltransferase [Clostridia bacterium]